MPCFESDTTIEVVNIDEANTNYVSFQRNSPITISFVHTGGSISSVQVDPSGPTITAATHSVTFGTAHLNTDYAVTVSYTDPPASERGNDTHVQPLETPVKKPTFRPVGSCPP